MPTQKLPDTIGNFSASTGLADIRAGAAPNPQTGSGGQTSFVIYEFPPNSASIVMSGLADQQTLQGINANDVVTLILQDQTTQIVFAYNHATRTYVHDIRVTWGYLFKQSYKKKKATTIAVMVGIGVVLLPILLNPVGLLLLLCLFSVPGVFILLFANRIAVLSRPRDNGTAEEIMAWINSHVNVPNAQAIPVGNFIQSI